jgi:hypothetical protein
VHPRVYQAFEETLGPVPDLIFLLGGTPENLLERAQGRTEETHQAGKRWNNAETQRRIQETYLRQLMPLPQTVWVDTDVLGPQDLFDRYIWPPAEKLLLSTGLLADPGVEAAVGVIYAAISRPIVPEPKDFVRRKTPPFLPGQVQ